MKKKGLQVLLAAVTAASLLCGCGGGSAYEPKLPEGEEEAEIYVEKIDGITDDFIRGVDVSSVLAEEESGVVYYNKDGEETDLFQLLADAGVNYVRVRVWNDPYDEDGNGYGGGNCDAEKAGEIGKRAAEYGMKLSVDFHYSDFWADPSKQFVPKAWADCSLEEKEDLLYEYTKDSLKKIIKAGADVGMVQIGNEINYGMAGETSMENITALLKSGSKAVREVAKSKKKDIKIAVHYTDISSLESILEIAGKLDEAELDYDVFGVSYYTFWHGTQENMKEVLSSIAETYGKETCVMETSYAYTTEDGDQSSNSVGEADLVDGYPATPQGQANCIRDVMASAFEAGALGVFYWEPAWIPVGDNHDSNQKLWEQYGSGWASSYASDYDPNDAGKYYGGSSWDNQALFDFDGKALPSLDVFKYVKYGAVGGELQIIKLKDISIEAAIGSDLELPDAVEAVYNDSRCKDEVEVHWNEEQTAAVDTSTAGTYTVRGTDESGEHEVMASIKVANINYVKNASFEDADSSMWNVTYEGDKNPTDIQTKPDDAVSGENAFHFYSDSGRQVFTVEQTLSGLPAGTYAATAHLQGGDVGSDAKFYLYVTAGGQTYESEAVVLDGWVKWKTPTISGIEVDGSSDVVIGISADCAANGWGTFDDFEFYSMK